MKVFSHIFSPFIDFSFFIIHIWILLCVHSFILPTTSSHELIKYQNLNAEMKFSFKTTLKKNSPRLLSVTQWHVRHPNNNNFISFRDDFVSIEQWNLRWWERVNKLNVQSHELSIISFFSSFSHFLSINISIVSMETTVFGAGLGMCALVVVFFLYMNRKWCFSTSGNFPCCDEKSLSTKTIQSFSK